MAWGHSENVADLYKDVEPVCFIEDIENHHFHFKNQPQKNTFTLSPRLFAYQTKKKGIKFVFDLHKELQDEKDKMKTLPKIDQY